MKHTAPTDEAFGALPDGTLDSLLLPENIDTLIDILKYHVVGANAPSTTLSSGGVETLNGDDYVQVVVSDAGVMVNDASVVITDIIASNGSIHVIDSVLIPPTDDPLNPANGTPTKKPTKKPSQLPLFKPKSGKMFGKSSKLAKYPKTRKSDIAVKAFKSSKASKGFKASKSSKSSKSSKTSKDGKMSKTYSQ